MFWSGGSPRHRRSGQPLVGFCFLCLLFCPSFDCVLSRSSLGDSGSPPQAQPSEPLVLFTTSTISTGRTVGRSPLANTAGRTRSSHPLFVSLSFESRRLPSAAATISHRPFPRLATFGGYRSSCVQLSRNVSNLRSDRCLILLLRCTSLSDLQSQGFLGLDAKKIVVVTQLRWLLYRSRKSSPTLAPLDCHSCVVRKAVHIGDSLRLCCFSRRERYWSLTPFVLKLLDKRFFVNLGSRLHGIDDVLDSVVLATFSPEFIYRRKESIFDRLCSRLSAVKCIGFVVFITYSDVVSSGKNLLLHRNALVPQLLLPFSDSGVLSFSAVASSLRDHYSERRFANSGGALIQLVGQWPISYFTQKPCKPEFRTFLGQLPQTIYGPCFGPNWLFLSRMCLSVLSLVIFGVSLVVFCFFKIVGLSPWLENPCRQSPTLL